MRRSAPPAAPRRRRSQSASPRRSPSRSTPRISRARARRLTRSPGSPALEPAFDARWREVDVGEWLGLTPEEVQARIPTATRAGSPAARAGSRASRTPRWRARGLEAARDVASAHAGATQPVVCVTHGGVIRAILMHVLGMPPESRRLLATGRTGTITAIDARAPVWRLRSYNDAGHLPGCR